MFSTFELLKNEAGSRYNLKWCRLFLVLGGTGLVVAIFLVLGSQESISFFPSQGKEALRKILEFSVIEKKWLKLSMLTSLLFSLYWH